MPRIAFGLVAAALHMRLDAGLALGPALLWGLSWNLGCAGLSLVMEASSRSTFLAQLGPAVAALE